MACDLTQGRLLPCKDVVGGIQKVWFVDFGDLGAVTVNTAGDDEVTAIGGTGNAYEYIVKGSNSLEQNFNVSRENGTTFFEQVLNLTLTKLTKEDNKELKLIAYGRPNVFVQDYNGNTFACGLENGMEGTGGTIVTGTAMGDLSGYTLTLTGMEKLPANFMQITGATLADPFGDATITIVPGTPM